MTMNLGGMRGCYIASLDLVNFHDVWKAADPDFLSFRNVSSHSYLEAFLLYAQKSSQNLRETPAPKGIIWQLCSGSRWPIFLLQALLFSHFIGPGIQTLLFLLAVPLV